MLTNADSGTAESCHASTPTVCAAVMTSHHATMSAAHAMPAKRRP
jgi:hypothetical protein